MWYDHSDLFWDLWQCYWEINHMDTVCKSIRPVWLSKFNSIFAFKWHRLSVSYAWVNSGQQWTVPNMFFSTWKFSLLPSKCQTLDTPLLKLNTVKHLNKNFLDFLPVASNLFLCLGHRKNCYLNMESLHNDNEKVRIYSNYNFNLKQSHRAVL